MPAAVVGAVVVGDSGGVPDANVCASVGDEKRSSLPHTPLPPFAHTGVVVKGALFVPASHTFFACKSIARVRHVREAEHVWPRVATALPSVRLFQCLVLSVSCSFLSLLLLSNRRSMTFEEFMELMRTTLYAPTLSRAGSCPLPAS